MAERIPIVPKTEFSFDGRTSSLQTVVLKERIPTDGAVSGVLEVRFHSHSGLTDSAQAWVRVVNETVSRDDPGTFFLSASAGPVAAVTLNNQLTPPTLLLAAFNVPICSMVQVRLEWDQGITAASGVQKIVIGVDLICRTG
jgi:hypothetical protein